MSGFVMTDMPMPMTMRELREQFSKLTAHLPDDARAYEIRVKRDIEETNDWIRGLLHYTPKREYEMTFVIQLPRTSA